ncbi:RNA polymerase sigma factor [Bradyrhizobium sp. 2TAF24]|uniref:RNA polymerase sigma factor n=1 Tax=Bradyrhizobium sp. 2TAF24 TaxID=3233011 RepID=UPI003F8D9916
MTDTSWAALRQLLVERYHDLRERLTRRLGSAELASEALHEVYLRLNRSDAPGAVASPGAYLFKAAYNVATDRRRSERRRARRTVEDADVILDIPDGGAGPDGIVEARVELAELARALMALPPRQRAILIAARYQQLPRAEIARRFGISRRTVQFELQRALEACRDHLDATGGDRDDKS